jgi:hypothetical protein
VALPSQVLIAKLPIVDADIRREALNQPLRFLEAARYRVAKMRAVSRCKAALEAGYSEVNLQVRARGKRDAAEKLTEGHIKAKILLNKQVRRLQQDLQTAEEREEFSKLLLEAYRMRRDAIRIVAEMQNYEGVRETAEVERIEQNRRLENKARELHRRRVRNGD